MIRLVHLSKTYGGTVAVSDVNLHVQPGEVFGFIGPNGAGKTTTIKMMAGLLSPTKGSVFIDGVDMAKEPVRAKLKIGLIPDRPFLYEKLTAMEFLQFTAGLYNVGKQAFAEKSRELLGRFSLLDRANELIEAFSHGMKQRLIMCAALLHEPRVLIVDEPMVGLDPRGIKMVKELFRDSGAKRHHRVHVHAHAPAGRGSLRPDRHHSQGQTDGDRHAPGSPAAYSERGRGPGAGVL